MTTSYEPSYHPEQYLGRSSAAGSDDALTNLTDSSSTSSLETHRDGKSNAAELRRSVQQPLHLDPDGVDYDLTWKLALSAKPNLWPSSSKFRYTPLPDRRSLRLLRIENRRYNHPLGRSEECPLLSFSLDSPQLPKYTTLSYAWGESFRDGSHLSETLPCNGALMKVTPNVRRALERVYESVLAWATVNHDCDMLLWIDAICINQTDPEERSSQVALMAEIYAKCNTMIIWLGEHSANAEQWLEAFRSAFPFITADSFLVRNRNPLKEHISALSMEGKNFLKQLLRYPPIEFMGGWVSILREIVQPSKSEATSREDESQWPKTIGERQALVELTNRSWFHRKWVVQETAQTIGKPRFFLISNQLVAFEEIEDEIRHFGLEDTASPLIAVSGKKTLLQNLSLYKNTQTSEPLDHVYALLGLSNDVAWLTVDYSQDAEQVYIAVAEHYIQSGNGMAVLALATAQRSSKDLPSWVPDWREPWRCDRSHRHRDVMITLSSGDRKLWRAQNADMDYMNILQHNSGKALLVKTWLIPNCTSAAGHAPESCRACRLLEESNASGRQGKQPLRTGHFQPAGRSMFAERNAAIRQKWSTVIREQFEVAMHSDEVLCLFENCALGFVLLPTGDVDDVSATPTYRIEFCFQIDEEIGMSNWFATALGLDSQERVFIV